MKRIELEGKTFGKLKVLKYLGNQKYLCKCDCGKETIVIADNLVSGHTTSCGCNKLTSDLTNKRFGLLVVQSRDKSKKSGDQSRSMWLCKCDCGNTCSVRADSLIDGGTTSCGCNRKGIPQELKNDFIQGTQLSKLYAPPTKANKSGVVGVNWDKSRNLWQVGIRVRGKRYNVGRFADLQEAIAAREKAVEEFHKPIIDDFKKENNEKTK